MPWMPYMIAIPAIFNFIKISLDYFGKAKPQTLQVNSVTHQLELLRFRKDHQPSIRWFAGDKLYLWSFSAAYSSWCVALRIHCIAAKVTFSTILGQFSNFELCLPFTCQQKLVPEIHSFVSSNVWLFYLARHLDRFFSSNGQPKNEGQSHGVLNARHARYFCNCKSSCTLDFSSN